MYAIFRALGKQFRAEKGKLLQLPLMEAEPGTKITFDEVLLSSDGETITGRYPAGEGRHGHGRSHRRRQRSQDLRLEVQAPEELSPRRPAIGRSTPKCGSPTSRSGEDTMAHKKGVGSSRNGRTQQSAVSRRQALRG